MVLFCRSTLLVLVPITFCFLGRILCVEPSLPITNGIIVVFVTPQFLSSLATFWCFSTFFNSCCRLTIKGDCKNLRPCTIYSASYVYIRSSCFNRMVFMGKSHKILWFSFSATAAGYCSYHSSLVWKSHTQLTFQCIPLPTLTFALILLLCYCTVLTPKVIDTFISFTADSTSTAWLSFISFCLYRICSNRLFLSN